MHLTVSDRFFRALCVERTQKNETCAKFSSLWDSFPRPTGTFLLTMFVPCSRWIKNGYDTSVDRHAHCIVQENMLQFDSYTEIGDSCSQQHKHTYTHIDSISQMQASLTILAAANPSRALISFGGTDGHAGSKGKANRTDLNQGV